MPMHADELPITAAVVRDLVRIQFPQWRDLPVRRVASPGTVNAIFRIGDRLAARFPLQGTDPAAARRLLESEGAAASELAGASRFPVPEQVALGEPGPGYPLPWSVQAWLPGRTGDEDDPSGSAAFAADLAEFIAGVRAIDTRGRMFAGEARGGDLKDHDAWISTCLSESEGLLDVRRLSLMWAAFRELPREAPDVMSHGDLTPGNVLVAGGHLAGVIDVGGFGPADPALDLISAWNLLEAGPRQVLRDALRCTDLEWERGKAWAFQQAMGLVWYYVTSNPVMSRLGRTTLGRIQSAGRPLRQLLGVKGAQRVPVPLLKRRVVDRLVRDREPVVPGPDLHGVRDPGRGQRAVKQRRVLGGEPVVLGGAGHVDGRADLVRRQVRAARVVGDGHHGRVERSGRGHLVPDTAGGHQRQSAAHAVPLSADRGPAHLRPRQQEVRVVARVGDDPLVGQREHEAEEPVPLLLIGERGLQVERRVVALAVVDVRDQRHVAEAREPVSHREEGIPRPEDVGEDEHARPRAFALRHVQCALAHAVTGGDLHINARHCGLLY
jgi:aminoglycoside phosphotransferase (APT) family kinase protein